MKFFIRQACIKHAIKKIKVRKKLENKKDKNK